MVFYVKKPVDQGEKPKTNQQSLMIYLIMELLRKKMGLLKGFRNKKPTF